MYRNKGYPIQVTTANSPSATVAIEKNKGNPKTIYNSTPINALHIVGHNVATKRFFDFVMPINAAVVQAIPHLLFP